MDHKRRRAGAHTNGHPDTQCNTDSNAEFHSFTDGDSTSYSNRTAASDTRSPPDTSLVTDLLPFFAAFDRFCCRCLKILLAFFAGCCALS